MSFSSRKSSTTSGISEHLIVQTAFLGDLLLSIPLINNLRRLYPDDKITLLCRRGLGAVLKDLELVDEVVEVDKSKRDPGFSWDDARQKLHSRQFENILCPHESVRSALFVARLNARRKIGYRRFFNSWIFTDRISRQMELPEALRQLQLLTPLDGDQKARLNEFAHAQKIAGGQLDEKHLAIVPKWAEMKAASSLESANKKTASSLVESLSLKNKPNIFLAPGSVWPTKMWTESGFIEVGQALSQTHQIVVMGSKDESEIAERIARAIPGACSIAGKTTLTESLELLSLAKVLVCNDSGAMHLAAAAGVPTVSIFGPTILEFGYRPWQNAARVVQTEPGALPCRPCGKHGARVCPIGTHICMKGISAQAVLTSVRELLELNDV